MKPLFLDIDTQNDFVLPAGALYAPGAERVISRVAALNKFAVGKGFPLISTACLHQESDPEFQGWPPHCIAETVGQLKPAATLVGPGQQVFTKQTTDVFLNSGFLPLLESTAATEYIVYGVVTEVCVRFAAEGLLSFGKPVTVIRNAVCALNLQAEEEFFSSFRTAGGSVAGLSEILVRLS